MHRVGTKFGLKFISSFNSLNRAKNGISQGSRFPPKQVILFFATAAVVSKHTALSLISLGLPLYFLKIKPILEDAKEKRRIQME